MHEYAIIALMLPLRLGQGLSLVASAEQQEHLVCGKLVKVPSAANFTSAASG